MAASYAPLPDNTKSKKLMGRSRGSMRRDTWLAWIVYTLSSAPNQLSLTPRFSGVAGNDRAWGTVSTVYPTGVLETVKTV
jgi:hypothetical protein